MAVLRWQGDAGQRLDEAEAAHAAEPDPARQMATAAGVADASGHLAWAAQVRSTRLQTVSTALPASAT
jgi:hypothetical protein